MRRLLYLPSLIIVLTFLVYEKLWADDYRWVKLIFLSAFLGIYTAEIIVNMGDWVKELGGIL